MPFLCVLCRLSPFSTRFLVEQILFLLSSPICWRSMSLENTCGASVFANIVACCSFLRNHHPTVLSLNKSCIPSIRAVFQKTCHTIYHKELLWILFEYRKILTVNYHFDGSSKMTKSLLCTIIKHGKRNIYHNLLVQRSAENWPEPNFCERENKVLSTVIFPILIHTFLYTRSLFYIFSHKISFTFP